MRPYILSIIDSRQDLGKVLPNAQVEICWVFPLTMEKFRLKATASYVFEKEVRDLYWAQLGDDQQLVFKSMQPGQAKAELNKDIMCQYEPQALNDVAMESFRVVKFEPYTVDHLLMARPQVVADSRRKP